MTDVVIIGGGPAGSTVGSLLRKYRPDLSVLILERERFPREHVGESQLPPVSEVLHEMGAWDKIEAADFPIKVGGTYRWGQTDDLWDFEFLPLTMVEEQPRPAPYAGWRTRCALQVDRAIYDEILLNHAAELGCEVRQETKVNRVVKSGDAIEHLVLQDGSQVEARYYVDASGGAGLLRRAMGVECDVPSELKNIAIWDYWQNADWAVEIGVGGTRIQIMSLEYGWIWFIPLGPTRTSVGLVVPADYLAKTKEKPADIYRRALREEPRIAELLKNATPEGDGVRTTKDWSFVAQRCAGENWFLVGESAGFADPILSAGMTLAHVGARELAYVLNELDRGELPGDWLKKVYDEAQRARVWQHIRFATFWYTGNGQFTELFDLTQQIAKDAGYEMDANAAFRWFASGSFTADSATATLAHHGMATAKYIAQLMMRQPVEWEVAKSNHLTMNLEGASPNFAAEYREGRIRRIQCFSRGEKTLRLSNLNELLVKAIQMEPDITRMMDMLANHFAKFARQPAEVQERMVRAVEALEALLLEGWVVGTQNPARPYLPMFTPDRPGPYIHPNEDAAPVRPQSKKMEMACTTS